MGDYAAEMSERGLSLQAIQAYERKLSSPNLSASDKAEIHFAIAEIYREKMMDCDNAIAHYIMIDYIQPGGGFAEKAAPMISECMEKTSRFMDARRTTEGEQTDSNKEPIIAVVRGVNISLSDLNQIIRDTMMDPNQLSREEKIELLSARISQELMADAAMRRGYQKDPDIQKKVEEFRRSQLANKIFQEEIRGKSKVSPEAVRKYYDENKSVFTDENGGIAPFELVSSQIYAKLNLDAQQKAAQTYLQSLLASEKTEIFRDKIPDKLK
jgi:peptidyl-prolyl cis-trans isomerase C